MILSENIDTISLLTAASDKPFALKKYFSKRLTGAGIVVDQSIFAKSHFANNKMPVDLFAGYSIKTYIKLQSYRNEDLEKVEINLKLKGRSLYAEFEHVYIVEKTSIDIIDMTIKQAANWLIKEFKNAVKKLIVQNDEKREFIKNNKDSINSYGEIIGSTSSETGKKIADSIGTSDFSVSFNAQSYGYRLSESFRINYGYSARHDRKNNILRMIKIMLDPTAKRFIAKEDKIDKEFNLQSASSTNIMLVNKKTELIKLVSKLYDEIQNNSKFVITEIYFSPRYLELGVRDPNSEPVKKEKNSKYKPDVSVEKSIILLKIQSHIKQVEKNIEQELDHYENIGIKYSHVILKRFFIDSEKFI